MHKIMDNNNSPMVMTMDMESKRLFMFQGIIVVHKVGQDNKDLLEVKDTKDNMDLKDLREHKDQLDQEDLLDKKDIWDHKDHMDNLDNLDHTDLKEE